MITKRKPKEQRRAPLDAVKKDEMLAVFVRNQSAFDNVYEMLTVDHVRRIGDAQALIWKVAREFTDVHGTLPTRGLLLSGIHAELTQNPDLIDDEDRSNVDELLDMIYNDAEHGCDLSRSETHAVVAAETCRTFFDEITAFDLRDRLVIGNTVPAKLPAMLEEVQARINTFQSLSGHKIEKPFPENWDKRQEVLLVSTGSSGLDALMGGGWRGKEVMVFLGPYGSCKTSTCCHAVSRTVTQCRKMKMSGDVRKSDGKPMTPVVVLAFTESDIDHYRIRMLSNLARVPWKKLAAMSSLDDLSRSKKPGSEAVVTDENGRVINRGTFYEKKEFAADIKNLGSAAIQSGAFDSEWRRVLNATKICNEHLALIDCTDNDDSLYKIGSGGMTEVANVIDSYFRRRTDCYPVAVWIDHIAALADRKVELDGKDGDDLHAVLKRMPRIAQQRIAKRFNCPVGLMHQFSGETNRKGPTSKFHHADAEGSKAVAQFADFAICTGPVNESSLCLWECTKHRREPPLPRRTILVDGDFNRVNDVSHEYCLDPYTSKIINRGDQVSQSNTQSAVSNIAAHQQHAQEII